MMKLLLGSQSPRRKEILSYFEIPFIQIASDFDEESVAFTGDPAQYATTLSQKKAEQLVVRFPELVILTADTVVYFEGKLFNKPKDTDEAFSMLQSLSGKWHQVFTAVTVRKATESHSAFEVTNIQFNGITDDQIRIYHEKCPALDKAGAYAIQQSGALLVRKIEGAFDNVMGLPMNTVNTLLAKVGIDLWKYLKPF
jgi:septum formation protein